MSAPTSAPPLTKWFVDGDYLFVEGYGHRTHLLKPGEMVYLAAEVDAALPALQARVPDIAASRCESDEPRENVEESASTIAALRAEVQSLREARDYAVKALEAERSAVRETLEDLAAERLAHAVASQQLAVIHDHLTKREGLFAGMEPLDEKAIATKFYRINELAQLRAALAAAGAAQTETKRGGE